MEVILLFLVLLLSPTLCVRVESAGEADRNEASVPTIEVVVACGRYPTGDL